MTLRMSQPKSRSRQAESTALRVPSILLEGDQPPERSGPVQKYATTASQSGTKPTIKVGLPEAYGTGKLGIIARDPRCVYVFWDATREQQERLFGGSGQGELVIRIEEKATGRSVSELHADLQSRSWFMRVPQAGVSYRANLGFAQPGQGWMSIAVSEVVRTPSDSVSMEREVRFGEVAAPRVCAAVSVQHAGGGIEEFGVESMPWETEQPEFDLGLPPVEAWSAAREQALEKVINLEEIRREWIGSLEIAHLIAAAGLQGELGSRGGQPMALVAGGAEALGSPLGGMPAGPRQFWFNLNAELVVYGATEPNARVTLGGREIKLRPDGTFSYRFALPDGFFELSAEAISVEQEKRAAVLRFTRQTEYQGEVGEQPQEPAG